MVAMMGSVAPQQGWRKGPWTHEEDKLLSEYVSLHGEGRWSLVAKFAGLNRSGKSCRLRWVNYLKPGLKKGQLTPLEEGIIIELHAILGNKWSTIAKYLPGRTDNEIKNYWRTHFNKREKPNHKKQETRRKAKELKQVKQEQQLEQQPQEQHETKSETKFTETQDTMQQEMNFVCPTMEDQVQHSFSLMYQEFSSSWPDTAGDDGLWSSLWDIDEPQGLVDQVNLLSKHVMPPNQANFGGGGDSSMLAMQNQDKTSRFDDTSNNLCYGKYLFG